jgi:hypothetical protein
MMYGKPRIVFQKNAQIVLAGGRSWYPVGILTWSSPGSARAKILKNKYSRWEGWECIEAKNGKALREIINNKYKWIEK